MELINPYAVMRNTATHEAYKAYSRRAAAAWQPFLMAGLFFGLLVPQLLLLGSRWMLHNSHLDWRWALACMALPIALSAIFVGAGAVRMIRFRKDNPIPDEWRQIPRSNPLGRTPPSRG